MLKKTAVLAAAFIVCVVVVAAAMSHRRSRDYSADARTISNELLRQHQIEDAADDPTPTQAAIESLRSEVDALRRRQELQRSILREDVQPEPWSQTMEREQRRSQLEAQRLQMEGQQRQLEQQRQEMDRIRQEMDAIQRDPWICQYGCR